MWLRIFIFLPLHFNIIIQYCGLHLATSASTAVAAAAYNLEPKMFKHRALKAIWSQIEADS